MGTRQKIMSGKRIAAVILITTLLVASFLRLYRVREYLAFLGDEGRDALVWHRMVTKGEFTFLGPTASVGGFYLGPIYYYMALPFYWIFRDPVGPSIFVAMVGVATVWLVYKAGSEWFGTIGGLVAGWVYATSSLVVRYSRASWNPNPLPFFSLLSVYWADSGMRKRTWWKIVGSGICLGVAWQLHYLALILTPVLLLIIFVHGVNRNNKVFRPDEWAKDCILGTLALGTGWVIGFFPFLAFEIYHHFPNTRTVLEFVTRPGGAVLNFELVGLIRSVIRDNNRLVFTVFSWQDSLISQFVTLTAVVTGTIMAVSKRQWGIVIWFWSGISIFSLYQGSVSDYYYGFLFPVPAIFIGATAQTFFKRGYRIATPVILFLLLLLTIDQSNRWPIRRQPNRILEQTENIAREIILLSKHRPYNFALITGGNSDHAYRYFLERMSVPPTPLESMVTDQLVAVCEKQEPECQPLGNAIWEIAGFGRAEVAEMMTSPVGITVYRLVHNEDSVSLIGKPAVKLQ